MNNYLKVFSGATLAFVSQNAFAVTTPPLLDLEIHQAGASAQTCFATCDSQGGSGANSAGYTSNASGTNTLVLGKSPSIASTAFAGFPPGALGTDNFSSSGEGNIWLNYYFEINGPQTISIPVAIEGSGSATATGGTYTSNGGAAPYSHSAAGFGVYQLEQQGIFLNNVHTVVDDRASADYGVGSTGGSITDSFKVDQSFDLQTNTLYWVKIYAESVASVVLSPDQTTINNLSASASVDPTFIVDPAYANDYSIALSPGLTKSVSAVPLPASMPMFAAALAAMGAAGYRKRRHDTVA